MNNFIVFTGGPSSGKTTVLNYLKGLGYQCANEVGRKVIQQQVEMEGKALPWDDKTAFRDEMMREEIGNYRSHKDTEELVFFDRSIIDSYGYSMLESLAVSSELIEYCSSLAYHKKVFMFPPWESIFANDVERKQDFSEAVATFREMASAYEKFGYTLVEVPKASVEQRVEFILAMVKNDQTNQFTGLSFRCRFMATGDRQR